MTEVLAYLEAVVGADISSFRRGMADVRGEIEATSGLAGTLQTVGTALTLGLTVPLGIAGAAAVKTFSDLDAAMRNVNSIMQLPEQQFQVLSDEVTKFGENTRNGTTAAAQALYTIVSAGFGVHDTAQAMQLLAVASKTAEAGLADENTTAQTLAQSLLAYGQSSSSAQHYADVLTQTVNLGVGSMQDVASSMGQAISVAALTGESFDNLNASAAFLTQRGMSFSNAYVSLNQVLTQLLKPTQGLTDAFGKLGVSSGTELIKKYGDLGSALQALGGTVNNDASALAKMFTNVRALRGAAAILDNFGDYTSLMNDFGASLNGVTDRAQQQQLLSFASQFDYLKSALQGVLDVIGKQLAPMLTPIIDGIRQFALQLSNANPQVIQMAINFGLVAAAVGPILLILSTIMSPIGMVVTGIALLGTAFANNFLGIRDAYNQYLKPVVEYIGVALPTAFNLIVFYVDYFGSSVKATLNKYFGNDISSLIKDVVVGDWSKAKDDLSKIWGDIGNLLHDLLVKPLTDLIQNIGPDKFFAIAGGIIAIGIALGVASIPAAITAISTALAPVIGLLSAIALGFGGIVIAAAPFIGIGLVVTGILLAWQNNFLGVRDRINELRDTLDKDLITFKQAAVILAYISGGQQGGLNMYNQLFGSGTTQAQALNATNSIPNVANTLLTPGLATKGSATDTLAQNLAQRVGLPSPTNGYGTQGAVPYNPQYNLLQTAPTMQNQVFNTNTPSATTTITNLVTVVSNDAQTILNALRAKGIDLQKRS